MSSIPYVNLPRSPGQGMGSSPVSADAITGGTMSLDDLKAVQDRIESGLEDSAPRMDCARVNEDYYQLRNATYIEKRESELDADYLRRPKRTVRLVRKAVDTLGRRLYHPGPSRNLVDESGAVDEATLKQVTDWLTAAYRSANANEVLAVANKRSILSDCAAIQVAATGDPRKPLKLWVYSAFEFEVFTAPDDPTIPWAVVTVSVKSVSQGQKKRVYTLYTDEFEYVYETKPYSQYVTSGGVRSFFVSRKNHRYGVLPFAFFHNTTPVDTFWGGGIGTALRETNAELDTELSDLAEQIQKFSCPDMFARNLPVEFRYRKQPGRPQNLPLFPGSASGESVVGPPEIFYLQPQLNVTEIWDDVNRTTTRLFADLDVPITSSWDDRQSPTSGLQVIAQEAPYLEYLLDRQIYAQAVEGELAKVCLTVAGNHYGVPELLAVAETAEMRLEFPAPVTLVPTPERNQDIEWRMQWGMMSQIEAIMQQRSVTRAEAEKILAQVVQDRVLVQEMTAGLNPIQPSGDVQGDMTGGPQPEAEPTPPEAEDKTDDQEPEASD